MINRTLIRLKTVQMLYSYLLTRHEFTVESEPQKQDRDSKSAYALYLDILLVILKLSGCRLGNSDTFSYSPDRNLEGFKLAKLLRSNDVICEVINKGNHSAHCFDNVLTYIEAKITSSEAYKDFCKKKKHEIQDEALLWSLILKTILAKDTTILQAAMKIDGFTQLGLQRAINMAVNTLTSCSDTIKSIDDAKKDLQKSLDKAYELYHAILLLMVEITRTEANRIESAKDKYLPSAEDLNPDTRFIENKFIQSIEYNEQMADYLKDNPISWEGDIYLIRDLLEKIVESEAYKNYMSLPEVTYSDDCELWKQLLKTVIVPSDALAESLESKSVFWNDDLDIMSTFVAKTIKQFAAAGNDSPGLLPKFKDVEDAKFGEQLFIDTIKNQDLYHSYITRFIDKKQWEADRIPFMDNVIISVIISELINFPLIPIPVTINEYVDIANRYSSPKSGIFINGIITNIIKTLREEGKIQK